MRFVFVMENRSSRRIDNDFPYKKRGKASGQNEVRVAEKVFIKNFMGFVQHENGGVGVARRQKQNSFFKNPVRREDTVLVERKNTIL